jgi:hypothetical protein
MVAALAVPAAASAAPIDLGLGAKAKLAVDATGTAHVTWGEQVSGQIADVAHYCQIAKGAAACTNPHAFTYPSGPNQGTESGVWPVLPGGSRVLVIDARCCSSYAAKFLYSSADGGTTFDAGTNVGNDNNLGADILGAALYAPAGALNRPAESVVTFASLATVGLSFQATGTTGSSPASTSANVLTQGDGNYGTLALSGSTLVAAWQIIDNDVVYWRQYVGPGDVNDQANWSPITALDQSNIDAGTKLAGGPSGIFVAYNVGSGAAQQVVVRRFNGTGWDAAVPVSDPGTHNRFDLFEDPTGKLHFVWQDSTGRLQYRYSTTPGDSSFNPALTLQPASAAGNRSGLHLAIASNGEGWATWEDSGHIWATAVGPGPPPPVEGSSVNAVPESGTVTVRLPAGAARHAKDAWTRAAAAGFVPLESLGRQIPVGSTLDTSRGKVHLFAATNASGGTQDGHFNGGLFVVGQGRKNPLTTLSMTGGGLGSCGKVPRGGSPKVRAARARKRTLFGDAHGRFSTRGRNSVATVRGTRWTMTDSCSGTLTVVQRGRVVVLDLVKHHTVTLKKGQRYLARRGNR